MAPKKTAVTNERANLRKKIQEALVKMDCGDAYVPLDGNTRQIDVIPSGSLVLDEVIGNKGWPRGRVVEIFGPESVGKSTVAIAACVEAQKQGGFACYIDFEHALHLGYAQSMGLDLSEDAFAFYQPNCFEDGVSIALMFTRIYKADIIVIDSVAAMIPKKMYAATAEDSINGMGLQARLMGAFMSTITKDLTKSNTLLMMINQIRTNIKTSKYDAGPDWFTSGGKALPYYATIRLHLKPSTVETINVPDQFTGEEQKIPISNFVKAEGHKNKVGFPKRKGSFCIRYGEGIDNLRSVIEAGLNYKVIKKEGSWYRYRVEGEQGHFRRQGVEQFRKYLMAHQDVFTMIVAEVRSKLASSSVMKIDMEINDEDIETEDRTHLAIPEDEIPEDVPDFSSAQDEELLSLEELEDLTRPD